MSRFLSVFIFLAICFAPQSYATTKKLLNAVIATGASTAVNPPQSQSTTVNQVFQAFGTVSASTGAATVKYQCSLDNVNWIDIGTVTLTLGTASTTGALVSTANYLWCRGNVTAISGTNATVTALVNY